ncbi:MAG: P-loop NTPase [Deltaproteobacteria bacterium]|nr:P-loop NTPase [Deltaproteobacteria bacterium]
MTEPKRDQVDIVEQRHQAARKATGGIRHKVLVMSGKGGVGKTTVAVNLGFALARQGLRVGILDSDLHGPDVAFMAGVEGQPSGADEGRLQPIDAGVDGLHVRVLSISAFLPNRDAPVIWRGPRKAGAIAQLLGEADWDDTDVMIIDCPPGTGDEPLSVAQLVPGAEAIIVTSPQDVALLDSRKCVNFARELELQMLGIVENLAGFVCPGCGRRIDLFKLGGGERAAAEMGVPFLGRIPITEAMVQAGDRGRPLVVASPDDPAAVALITLAADLTRRWNEPDGAKQAPDGAKQVPAGTKEAPVKGTRRIAVACEDDRGLDGQVSGHFGRCPTYTVVEVQDGKIAGARVEVNPHFGNHEPGVMPAFVHGLGADLIIAGGMGPRAIDMFVDFGIEVVTGAGGNVRRVVEAYLRGELKGIVPCSHDHPESCGGEHEDDDSRPARGRRR